MRIKAQSPGNAASNFGGETPTLCAQVQNLNDRDSNSIVEAPSINDASQRHNDEARNLNDEVSRRNDAVPNSINVTLISINAVQNSVYAALNPVDALRYPVNAVPISGNAVPRCNRRIFSRKSPVDTVE